MVKAIKEAISCLTPSLGALRMLHVMRLFANCGKTTNTCCVRLQELCSCAEASKAERGGLGDAIDDSAAKIGERGLEEDAVASALNDNVTRLGLFKSRAVELESLLARARLAPLQYAPTRRNT